MAEDAFGVSKAVGPRVPVSAGRGAKAVREFRAAKLSEKAKANLAAKPRAKAPESTGPFVSKGAKRALFGVSQQGLSRGLNMVKESTAVHATGRAAGAGARAVRERSEAAAASINRIKSAPTPQQTVAGAANSGAGDEAVAGARKLVAGRRRRNKRLAIGGGAAAAGAGGLGAFGVSRKN